MTSAEARERFCAARNLSTIMQSNNLNHTVTTIFNVYNQTNTCDIANVLSVGSISAQALLSGHEPLDTVIFSLLLCNHAPCHQSVKHVHRSPPTVMMFSSLNAHRFNYTIQNTPNFPFSHEYTYSPQTNRLIINRNKHFNTALFPSFSQLQSLFFSETPPPPPPHHPSQPRPRVAKAPLPAWCFHAAPALPKPLQKARA